MDFSLDALGGGALLERAAQAFGDVYANIADPNMPAKGKREVAVKVIFDPNEDRNMAQVSYAVATKLQGRKVAGSVFEIEEGDDGAAKGREYMYRQSAFADPSGAPTLRAVGGGRASVGEDGEIYE